MTCQRRPTMIRTLALVALTQAFQAPTPPLPTARAAPGHRRRRARAPPRRNKRARGLARKGQAGTAKGRARRRRIKARRKEGADHGRRRDPGREGASRHCSIKTRHHTTPSDLRRRGRKAQVRRGPQLRKDAGRRLKTRGRHAGASRDPRRRRRPHSFTGRCPGRFEGRD